MAVARVLVLLLLLTAAVLFAMFAVTGKPQYKRWGLVLVKWTVAAAVVFFGVLFIERLR